ncbi:MAG: hypothetical protein MUF50_04405 [Planctomycetes bacterium]|jgi:uncharacterized protein involved in exopolysaccharide biosynthesis|nr:hypothetical protein [Planctomycetota bacterium]
MELTQFIQLAFNRKKTIFSFVIIFLVIALIFTFSQPLKYEANSSLLIVQESKALDPYSLSKSNEYLSKLLAQVVYANTFFAQAVNSNNAIDKKYFGDNAVKQQKTWQKTVSTKSIAETGIIKVSVFHKDKNQVKQIASAINTLLINQNNNYQGFGDSVKVSVIDQPIVSNYPTKPNIPVNVVLSLVLGFIFSLIYIYMLPEEKYAFSLLGSGEKNKLKDKPNNQSSSDQNFLHSFQKATQTPTANTNQVPSSINQNQVGQNSIPNQVMSQGAPTQTNQSELKGNIGNIMKF